MGGKKGGSSHTPVEAKETGRSFQIARILEVLSEGEIYGLVDDMCSVYLDKTPLQNKDGTFNFKNVSVYANAGTQHQDVLKEFSSVEKEINVNTKILRDKPIIKTVTDTAVTRIRMTLGVERLIKQEDNGDTNGTSVTMTVQVIKDGRIHSSMDYTFNGKYSNPYREMFDLNVPQAPFQIKVIRVQPDSHTNKLQNNCFWSSYTEIIDKAFAYPNTALVGIKIDSEYFNDIPERNYEIYGLIVKVPSNYDAFKHTYTSDFWNGSFKLSWTNNPAWIFYDLVTNTRYGMGQRLQDFGIDKWQLYAIGRYCDELVPDGFGGKEPRMTCNIWITDQRKAYDLINDICSIFRAMPVWNGQALTAIQDRASDPVWTYNNANTIGGFTRQRSAKKARHNTIQVEYIDADDFYEKKVESVSDDALVARYGQNVKKVTAFGCTSRGQAYRTGRWLLETEKLETETITFTVGQEGVMHLPYDVIEVADSQYAGLNVGGRILAVNGTQVTLDRAIEIDDQSYLSYVSKQAITENVKIISFDKQTNIATLAKDVSGTPELTVWGLTTKLIATGLYRAISIKENDNSEGKTYTITALQHVPEKEDIVINGTHFDPKPQTIHGDVVDADIKYNGTKLTVSGKVNGSYNVLSSKQITSYTVKLLKDGALVYIEKGLKSPDINVDNLENGSYEAQISAYNEKGQLLNQYTKTFVINRPPLVTSINVAGHFTSIVLTWDLIDNITETEIWVSEIDDINTARLVERVTGCYYSHEVGATQVRYYWLRNKRGVNVGSFDQLQGRKGESGVDIDAELEVLNKELGKNIIEEIIDTALPARGLEPVKTVSGLDVNQFLGNKLVYNQLDGRLYTWNGTKYEYKTPASNINGSILPAQLAPIPTTKLSGQLTNAQIQTINAAKIEGQIVDAQISAVDVGKLRGVIPHNQLAQIPTEKLSGKIAAEQIQANAIGVNHIAAGVLTSDKLAVGTGGNLLYNPIFSNPVDGVPHGWSKGGLLPLFKTNCYQNPVFGFQTYFENENIIHWVSQNDEGNTGYCDLRQKVSVGGGVWYAFSVYLGNHRCNLAIFLQFFDDSGNHIVTSSLLVDDRNVFHGINSAKRAFLKAQAPDNAAFVNVIIRKLATEANGGDSLMFLGRPMLEECTQYTTEPSVWQNAGVTAIHGGSIVTESVVADKIATNAIQTQHLQAGAVNADKIATNAIRSGHILANSITSVEIAAGAVNTEQLAANSVSTAKMQANSIGANHLQANAVVAGKIAANAVTTATIQSNAIRTEHLAAGQISADKLAIGLGGNLLYNPIFSNPTNNTPDGWGISGTGVAKITQQLVVADPNLSWGFKAYLKNENIIVVATANDTGESSYVDVNQMVAVNAGAWYAFSAYVGNHRCRIVVYLQFSDKNLAAINAPSQVYTQEYAFAGIASANRAFLKAQAPDNAAFVNVIIRKLATNAGNQNSYLFLGRPMLEECTQYTTEPSVWQNAGVTAIHGGSIVANTITAQQILAGTITANELATGSVTAVKIAGGTITGDKLSSKTITSDKINVTSLSSLSANIGTVTAGTITGITISGNTINGGIIAGANISGGTLNINDQFVVDGNGVLTANSGIFKGKIYASNLIDDVATVYNVNINSHVTIPAFPKKRILLVVGANLSVRSGSTSGATSASVHVNISSTAGGVISRGVSVNGASGSFNSTYISGYFVIPANTPTTINYSVISSSTPNGGSYDAPTIPLLAIC